MYQKNQVEYFNKKEIMSVIVPKNQRILSQIEIFDSLDSTNSYLLTRAKENAPSGMVCLAENQTAARGRRGKSWFTVPNANIYCSILWRFSDVKDLSGLSLAVGVMIVNVLQKYGVSSGVQLKWPNDVLYASRKLAGILLEASGHAVVVGIGLNLWLPPEADPSWIAIHEITQNVPRRNYLTGLLINELLEKLPLYQQYGLEGFLDEWRSYDFLKDRLVDIYGADGKVISGVMRGVNPKGELLIEDALGNIAAFAYGEVSVRRS